MSQQPETTSPSFRDRIATVDEKGKRKWVYAKKPEGRIYDWRTWVSYGFFALFILLPFVEWKGRPLFLFNIPAGKFILFGKVFWPQDFFIFGLGMVVFIIFIVLFTAAFGRLFCGWVCPQTIFMEMLFRKVEYWIEGNATQQKVLNQGPWTSEKIRKKVFKHVSFFLLSFIIANFFLAYIIGVEELGKIITEPIYLHMGGFLALIGFSSVFYAVYAFFREQACTVVCPYGRLQGVLLDRNSLVVAYDHVRGEPRGKGKNAERASLHLGDCIDCHQCVRVCPTGIDIRNGTQLECVGCTACIDACDAMMDAIGKPRGLVRYASENGIAEKQPWRFTRRIQVYTALLIALTGLLAALLMSRTDVGATIVRAPGMLYQERGTDSLSNLYTIQIINKSIEDIPLTLRLENASGRIQEASGEKIMVKREEIAKATFFIVLPHTSVRARKQQLEIGLYAGNEKIGLAKTNFMGPFKRY
jgi:cytochrome c oxidase accessory protein FixG